MQSTTVAPPNGRVRRAGKPARGRAGDGMSGRKALGLMLLLMMLFGLVVGWLTVSRQWRQNERLVAPGLRNPRGVALTADDGLVVAEAGLPDVAGSGRLTWVAADSRGTLHSEMSGVAAVAAAPDDRILVLVGACDGPLCRALHALDKSGRLSKLADLGGEDPAGLTVAADGTVYVSDARTGDLTILSPAIVPGGVARLAALGPDAAPRGLAVGRDGAVYVALSGAGRVARVGPDGAVATAADGLAEPVGVGFEPDGRMLVLERGNGSSNGRLVRIDPAKPDESTVVSRDLPAPTSLLVAPDGRAYVTAGSGQAGGLLQIRRLGPQPARRVV
jgi:DNA-binding beta-propeller fold protein YncE